MTPTEQDTAFWSMFPACLRAARVACGLTMAVLADAAGIAPDSVFRHEHGVVCPTYPTLCRLCRVLAICPSSLFPPLDVWYQPARRGAKEFLLPFRLCHDAPCWTALP